MPPKAKISRENILATALDILREKGESALNARDIAAALQCSTQPIFSNFASMQDLKAAVVEEAEKIYQRYIHSAMESGCYPVYKASGMAYIRFAREEKMLFRLLYMRNRQAEDLSNANRHFDEMISVVQEQTGLKKEFARLFHLETWAFVHGIAAMTATDFLNLDEELISAMISDCFRGLKKHYEEKEETP